MAFEDVLLYVEFGHFMLQKYDFFFNYWELCGNCLLDVSFFSTRQIGAWGASIDLGSGQSSAKPVVTLMQHAEAYLLQERAERKDPEGTLYLKVTSYAAASSLVRIFNPDSISWQIAKSATTRGIYRKIKSAAWQGWYSGIVV